MCLAVPGRVISIDRSNPHLRMAKVDFVGNQRDICIEWLSDAKEGDYVLAHVGTALTLMDEEEALKTIDDLKKLGEI